jgi:hypothetical protein
MYDIENIDNILQRLFGEKRVLLFDTEYNNINSEKATKVWCISAVDVRTGETFSFQPKGEGEDQYHNQFAEEFREFIKDYDVFVGHHFWGAEAPVCRNLLGIEFDPDTVIDTLVLSRLQRPAPPYADKSPEFKRLGWDNRLGGHGLAAWGNRMGYHKIVFDNFSEYTHEMGTYCDKDVLVNKKMFLYLLWEQQAFNLPSMAVEVESQSHRRLVQQTFDGFTLHKGRAKKLKADTGELLQEYINELHKIFPPQKIVKRTITPRTTAKPKRDSEGKLMKDAKGDKIMIEEMHGTDRKTLINNMHEDNGDGTFNICEMEVFNPNSPQQVGARLMSLGWNPKKFTATGQPSVKKEVLGFAIDMLAPKVPEVEVLRKYNIISHRNSCATRWLELADEEGRVHGRVNHIGPWTHRCSHYDDNMANISKVKHGKSGEILEGLAGDFGWDSRHCWIAREGWALVGCDASGIQLRALAHYMGDPAYIKEVLEGDIHVANQKAAGIKDRPTAKTFIYAWLLGAGDEKIGTIVGVTEEEYADLFARAEVEKKYNRFRHKSWKERRGKFDNLLFYVTDKLRNDGRTADKASAAIIIKGYFTKQAFLNNLPALKEFRTVEIKKAAKQGYMESVDGRKIWVPSEHLAMGAYLQGFEAIVMKYAMVLYQDKLTKLGIPFVQCAFVHDEFQIETPKEHAETVGETVVWAIKEAGEMLGSKCPLDGEYQVGTSWAETH